MATITTVTASPKHLSKTLHGSSTPNMPIITRVKALPPSPTFNDWLELARFWKPAGTVAFHIPLIVGSLAYILRESAQFSLTSLLALNLQLIVSSTLQRSAACAWNDAADYKFDAQVARTRNRPIPRGSVSPNAARVYAAALTVAWYLVTVWPSSSPEIIWTLVPNFIFHIFYPYMKRVTFYPQLFLGFTFSLNVPTGYAMTCQFVGDASAKFGNQQIQQTLALLMLAEAAYAVFYDTIYAYQDYADDEKAGVGSPAVKFGIQGGRIALSIMIVIEIVCLVAAGWSSNAGLGYYILTCGGSAILDLVALLQCDLRVPEQCGRWFKDCLYYGMWIQASGFVVDYLLRNISGSL